MARAPGSEGRGFSACNADAIDRRCEATVTSDEPIPQNGDEHDAGSDPGDEHDADNDPDPLVRPYGFVEQEAIVRRIGDRDLYLGNEFAADPGYHDHDLEFVLSATHEARPLTTHHHPLTDGRGNEWAAFEAAVDDARRLSRRDGSLLVHCKAGVSRSTTILATALAAEEGREFADALAIVQDARPFATPNPALVELAVIYLAAESCRP